MTGNRRTDKVLLKVALSAIVLGIVVFVWPSEHPVLPALWFAAVPATVAWITYAVLAPWYRAMLGWILFSLLTICALLIDVTLINYMWDYPGQVLLAEILFLLAGCVFWTLCVYVVLVQTKVVAPLRLKRPSWTFWKRSGRDRVAGGPRSGE